MKNPAITPWSPVATDPNTTKLIKVWRDGKPPKSPELPSFINRDRVRVVPRSPIHPVIAEEWMR
ncbi:MAG: hypothetical protein AAFV85_23230 [Cyanobacteria bacterium J06634_6]